MTYNLEIKKTAQKDIEFLKKSDKKSFDKVSKLLIELKHHPKTGTGNPEQLKYELSDYWSRRINKKDRLIYSIEKEIVTVIVVSARGHYFDR